MTCLAFLVTVLAALAGLAPRRLRLLGPILTPEPAVVSRHIHWRLPSLAELCVLRT
jgi:hypothetical protein